MSTNIRLSIKPDCVGKDGPAMKGIWKPTEMDIDDLIKFTYVEGKAIAAGVFNDDDLGMGENTNKTNARWIGAQLIVVDVDTGTHTIKELVENPFVKKHCLAITPSSGYARGEVHKFHLFFKSDRFIEDEEIYKALSRYTAKNVVGDADLALARISQGLFGTVFEHESMVGFNKSMSDAYINQKASHLKSITIMQDIVRLGELPDGDTTNDRTKRFDTQDLEKQTELTVDAIEYAFKGWGYRTYEEWLALTISAYAGSNDIGVRDAIIGHPDVEWRRGGIESFKHWWRTFKYRSDGYTVATLFYHARKNGWLQYTDVDIPEEEYTYFNHLEVWDFVKTLDPLPERMLIVSNTGTGKTIATINALINTDIKKKAVFFAPSIKLCMALSATLTSTGLENTLYIENGKTKDRDTLKEAEILVTTLQTFAMKVVRNGIDIKEYEFVAIDESDELFSAFARAEIGYNVGHSSHVNRDQSYWGFQALKLLLDSAKHVILTDGTATQVSIETMKALSDKPLQVFKNKASREKAPVTFVPSLYRARELIYKNVVEGKKVVVVTDTRQEARTNYTFLTESKAISEDDVIMITGDTNLETKVRDFFKDVEAGADKYQVIIYNSAMGSGVSIVETVPDVVIQIATHIPPRNNLQMLNRFRIQDEVYCYMPPGDRIFYESVSDRLDRLRMGVVSEATLIGLEPVDRSFIAQTITRLAELSITDKLQQTRATRDFYIRLLREDNRDVFYNSKAFDKKFKKYFALAFEAMEEQKELIYSTWREVEPISRDNLPNETMDRFDMARGILHYWIKATIPNYEKVDVSDYRMAELVTGYGRYVRSIERWLDPTRTVDRSVIDLLSSNKAEITLRLYLSRMELVGLVGILLPDSSSTVLVSDEHPKALEFIREVELRENIYNSMVGSRNTFSKVIERKGRNIEGAITLANYILKSLGLKIKRKNGKRTDDGRERIAYIDSVDEILELMSLRGSSLKSLSFDNDKFYDILNVSRETSRRLSSMNAEHRNRVVDRMETIYMGYTESVKMEGSLF